MRIAVYGIGYVGSVTAACLASAGHDVLAVDLHPGKVDAINAGRSPIVEAGLAPLIDAAVRAGTLRATTSVDDAAGRDVALVCVGTPSLPHGGQDLSALTRVCRDLAARFGAHPYPVVIVRSTVLPGVLDREVREALERASGRRVGTDLGLCVAPEFLREGSGVADFYAPPMTLLGPVDPRAGDLAEALLAVPGAPTQRLTPDEAVLVKYASNAFHAMKVAFANEVDALAARCGADGRAVMGAFARDEKLNVSAKYLRPGFAFGGSCLPKDLRAMLHAARHHDLPLPLLESVLVSNERRVGAALADIAAMGVRRVAVLGLSFKPGTDDLRESPLVTLVETLVGRGYAVRVFDASLSLENLTGSNQRFITRALPHLDALLADSVEEATRDAELVVLGHVRRAGEERFVPAPGQRVLDLARGG